MEVKKDFSIAENVSKNTLCSTYKKAGHSRAPKRKLCTSPYERESGEAPRAHRRESSTDKALRPQVRETRRSAIGDAPPRPNCDKE